MLFVVSSSGVFEEKYIYEEIGAIAASGKPLVLVLNNKSGLEPDSRELAEIEAKLLQNLLSYGDAKGKVRLEELVTTVIVNARSALKGRLEHKPLLLEKSNLAGLEAAITHRMAGSGVIDSVRTIVSRLCTDIGESLAAIKVALQSQDASGIGLLRSYANDRKSLFLSRSRSVIDGEIGKICQKVRTLIEAQEGESAINSELENWLGQLTQQLQELQDKFIIDIQGKIDSELESLSGIAAGSPDLKFVGGQPRDGKSFGDLLGDQARNALKGLKPEHLKSALMGLRRLKVPGIKGRWEKTLGGWAGKAMPYVQVVVAIWDLWSGYKEDEEQVDRTRQQVMQINRAVDGLRHDLRHNINQQLNDWVKQVDDEIGKLFDETASLLTKETEALLSKQAELNKIHVKLNLLMEPHLASLLPSH